ncbi:MAG TPA: serine/threonine-protein kinase, partial [Kofleriaceae bacterium]|nr:serine/threonine-protein kinase [Kofleriaceae bacterium]
DVDTERDFIVMELVRGESLRAKLKRERVLSIQEIVRVGQSLLDALAAAHAAKIVHRDVKPANILIDEANTIKLVDFGIASFGDRDLTSTGVRIGTPAYMAPEQLRGRVADVRADLYAVGATLFEAATGEQLHASSRAPDQVTAAVLAATGDAALASAITRAVAEQPDDRFASAREFADALGSTRHLATDDAAKRPAKHADDVAKRPARRRWWLAGGAAVIAAGALVVLARPRGHDMPVAARTAAAPADATHERPSIAVLPFIDHTGEARLDFAASGLPHILATQLRSIPELHVLGYYELLDHLPSGSAPAEAWERAARSLGAETVIHGEIFTEQAGIRVVVKVTTINGGELGRFERMTSVDSVPAATRSIAADVARVAVGRAPQALGDARKFEIDRNLQLAISAIERQDFTAADGYLDTVEREAPDLAEAQYYRALLNWWLSRPIDAAVTRALAGNLESAQRGFMEGLKLVYDQSHLTPAINYFRELVTHFPDHREINYGLFEALYHGGFPAEAMVVYRRLALRHPRFKLGLKHALSYYVGHADDDGMRWAIARLEPDLEESLLWQARAHVARREYAAAIALLRRHDSKGATFEVRRELVEIYLLDGQFELAADVAADWSSADVPQRASQLLALANAFGDVNAADAWSHKAAAAAELMTGSDERERGWLELAAIEMPDARRDRLRPILPKLTTENINQVVAHTLVAGTLDERTLVDAARKSEFPEVVAVANALHAEATKNLNGAADYWKQAVDTAADGNFVILEQLARARVFRKLGDHAEVLKSCDEVIRPRRFAWAWGSAIGPCLRWSAEAAAALGNRDVAIGFAKRLLALRMKAPDGDPLVKAAREIAVR